MNEQSLHSPCYEGHTLQTWSLAKNSEDLQESWAVMLGSCQPYRQKLQIDPLGWRVRNYPSNLFLDGPLGSFPTCLSVHIAHPALLSTVCFLAERGPFQRLRSSGLAKSHLLLSGHVTRVNVWKVTDFLTCDKIWTLSVPLEVFLYSKRYSNFNQQWDKKQQICCICKYLQSSPNSRAAISFASSLWGAANTVLPSSLHR